MSWNITNYPSTQLKAIWAQLATILLFLFSLWLIAKNIQINEFVYGVLAASVFGTDVAAVTQFGIKRKTAWVPAQTPSEAGKDPATGQPAAVALPPIPPGVEETP